MAWAALLKSAGSKAAQQSGKKIAEKITKKVTEKKSKVKGKDVAKKMLGGGGESSGGGGALAIRPSTSIVSSPAGGLVPSTKVDEGGALVVKSKGADDLGLTSFMESITGVKESVKSIKDSLNDNSEDAEKRLEKQRLLNAKLKKEEDEEDLEGKKPGIGKKLLSPIQKMGESFLEKLKRFFKAVLLGVLINGLIGGQRDVVVAFILGYKAYRMAKDAAIKFIFKISSSIKGGLKSAAGKLANSGKNIFNTLVNVGKALVKWIKKGIQIVIKGAGEAAKRSRPLIKAGQEFLQKVKPVQRLQGGLKSLNKLRKTPINETIKSIQSSGIGKSVGGTINKIRNFKLPKLKLPKINWKNIGSGIKDIGIKTFQKAKQSGAGQFIGKQANRFTKNITAMQDTANGLFAGGMKRYRAWKKNIEAMMELVGNPGKLFEKSKALLSGKMDKVMKNNKTWQTLKDLKKMKPGQIAGKIGGMVKGLGKSKEVMKVVGTLKNAKQTMKLPMLDRILALILGVVDYALLGESPVNAFAKALGGLLGFSFGTALGAPLGPGAFVTGIAGGIVGEQLGNGLSATLASIKGIKDLKDPIMNDGRPLVRNPFGKGAEEFDQAQEELSTANLAEGKSSASGDIDISQYTSYEDGGEDTTVVIDGGGDQAAAPTSQSRKVEYLPLGTGDSGEVLNTLTNATLYKT